MASRRNVLDKTAAQITTALRETLTDEEGAGRPGLLQKLDPRTKVVATLVLLLAAALVTRIQVLVGLYLLTWPLAWLSRLPFRRLLRRVWLVIPLFTAVVALPALFTTTGDPGLILLSHPVHLVVTVQGARTVLTLILRTATLLSWTLLLVLSTRWAALLKALRVLRLPQPIVLLLSMTRRYIFLLLQKAEEMLLARRSRMMGRLPDAAGRRMAAGMAGTLLAHSYQLSQEVQLAMEARGFRGEVRLAEEFHWQAQDTACLAVALLLGGVTLWIGR
jgi:cobalt/nickel transport system permease protein